MSAGGPLVVKPPVENARKFGRDQLAVASEMSNEFWPEITSFG